MYHFKCHIKIKQPPTYQSRTMYVPMYRKETPHRVNQWNLCVYLKNAIRLIYLGNVLTPDQDCNHKRIGVPRGDNGIFGTNVASSPEDWKQIMTYLEWWYFSNFVNTCENWPWHWDSYRRSDNEFSHVFCTTCFLSYPPQNSQGLLLDN